MKYTFFYAVITPASEKGPEKVGERTMVLHNVANDYKAVNQVKLFWAQEKMVCAALGKQCCPGSFISVKGGMVRHVSLSLED